LTIDSEYITVSLKQGICVISHVVFQPILLSLLQYKYTWRNLVIMFIVLKSHFSEDNSSIHNYRVWHTFSLQLQSVA